ncbi:hypothetical protein R1flu_006533 [Riccia fluitans]|uniref:Uncharacterized protein n=1 Tax=Riccia fluitans TaxID=41844 RepID=A0ABD1YXC6_9MARC
MNSTQEIVFSLKRLDALTGTLFPKTETAGPSDRPTCNFLLFCCSLAFVVDDRPQLRSSSSFGVEMGFGVGLRRLPSFVSKGRNFSL